jgi:hypothetical protein
MTSPAVVILTEPERCDLADADALVEALLQVQRLGQAGMSVSQTLCDHPADAMKFIDAYAKAYPELQLQSSELPVPEQLYSMIADGRLSALQAPVSRPDAAKLDDAGRLQPLYVLSLGAPEILMQALQDNRLANNAIRLVEVAPVEDPNGERLSVAEAVSSRAVVSSSWNVEESAEFHADERALLPLEDVDSQPLKLDTVEPDLDHIVIDGEKDQFPAAPTLLDTGRAARAPADAGADRPVQSNAATASSETTSGDTSAAPAAVAAPVPEARDVARTETSPEQSSSPIVPDRDPKLSEQDLVSDDGQSEETPPPADEAAPPENETAPPDGLDSGPDEAPDAGAAPDTPDAAAEDDGDASESSTSATDTTGTDARENHSFSDPDDDVLYPPSGGFTTDEDDLAYSLPPEGDPGFASLHDYLGLLVGDDSLDLEAIGRSLPPAGNESADHLDPVLMRPPGSGEHGPAGAITPPDASASYSAEGIEHDRSDAHEGIVTTHHDLDI